MYILEKRHGIFDFVHVTTADRLHSIFQKGILPSEYGDLEVDGNDGAGIYVIRNVQQMMERVLKNHFFAETGVIALHFQYAGDCYECVGETMCEEDYDDEDEPYHTGYFVIPRTSENQFDRILPDRIFSVQKLAAEEISKTGKEIFAFQERLARKHRYQPVPIDLFLGDVREKYREALPEWCKENGDESEFLFTAAGTMVARGYRRIVIGDYGAFLEIAPEDIFQAAICCKPGQEYRYREERYAKHVKYFWLTAKDTSDCKIYHQKATVSYADYVPGMYYVSPYEVFPAE